jgi:addiction module RelE/StbE family toxin
MRKVVTSSRFEKRLSTFIKQHPELSNEVQKVIQILAVEDLLPAHLRAQKLQGPLEKCSSVRISYSYRLLFIRDSLTVSLIDIGNHDETYR